MLGQRHRVLLLAARLRLPLLLKLWGRLLRALAWGPSMVRRRCRRRCKRRGSLAGWPLAAPLRLLRVLRLLWGQHVLLLLLLLLLLLRVAGRVAGRRPVLLPLRLRALRLVRQRRAGSMLPLLPWRRLVAGRPALLLLRAGQAGRRQLAAWRQLRRRCPLLRPWRLHAASGRLEQWAALLASTCRQGGRGGCRSGGLSSQQEQDRQAGL